MRDVFIVKQAVATVLGQGLTVVWEGLLSGGSAFGAGRPVMSAPATGACENRVCALTRRVLEALRPVPARTGLLWTGIKGNAEFIESGQAAGMPWLAEHYRKWAAGLIGAGPASWEINAACASSTVGMAIAAHKIASGQLGCAVVCGGDAATEFIARGFAALKALTPARCRPFDVNRDGMCLGDGAVAVLLANAATASQHRLKPLAKISGWGIANDASHITGPAADGAGLMRAIQAALDMSGLTPDGVEAFCAHGTGTVFNDAMELAALDAVFGGRRFPVFSIKGALGHTLGAAGGLDMAVCVEALRERKVPPTAGLINPAPGAEGRVSDQAQVFPGCNILTSNSGFGGINAALLLTAV